MNIIKRLVKEALLVPKQVVSGAWEALDETVNGKPPSKGKKE